MDEDKDVNRIDGRRNGHGVWVPEAVEVERDRPGRRARVARQPCRFGSRIQGVWAHLLLCKMNALQFYLAV
jgi:hypothetical protein